MRKGKLILTAVVAVAGVCVAGGPARAHDRVVIPVRSYRPAQLWPVFQPPVVVPRHHTIDALAHRLEGQAREVLREFRAHFGRSPRFHYLERDVLEMARLADHVHDVAHRGGSLAHLRSDVNLLDRLFHRIEGQVDELCVLVRLDPRGAAHLRADLARLGRTLHQLRGEIY